MSPRTKKQVGLLDNAPQWVMHRKLTVIVVTLTDSVSRQIVVLR